MKVSELYKRLDEGPITDKIKSMFKGKKKISKSTDLQPLTAEDREMISKIMPSNNSDITWSDGNYVLPTNVTAYAGKGRINFYKMDDKLYAGVGYYNSSSDAQNPRVSPIVLFDEEISSIDDLKKLKSKLEA